MLVPICATYTAPVNDASSEPVSLGKSGAGGSSVPNGSGAASAGGGGAGAASGAGHATKPTPPRLVLFAVIALGISGVAAVLSSIALYSQDTWLFHELSKS